MEGNSTCIVEKELETGQVVLGIVVPYYATVVNNKQSVRLEKED